MLRFLVPLFGQKGLHRICSMIAQSMASGLSEDFDVDYDDFNDSIFNYLYDEGCRRMDLDVLATSLLRHPRD